MSQIPEPVFCHSVIGCSRCVPAPLTVPAPTQYQCPDVAGFTSESGADAVPPVIVDSAVLVCCTTQLWIVNGLAGAVGAVIASMKVSENCHRSLPLGRRAE